MHTYVCNLFITYAMQNVIQNLQISVVSLIKIIMKDHKRYKKVEK